MTDEEQKKRARLREAAILRRQTIIERYGPDHFARAGALGGKATAAKHGREHYERCGRKGGKRLRELTEAGKRAEEIENG